MLTELPNELLLWIVSHLDGSALFTLEKSCKDFDFKLQPSIWRYNIKFQNSNLLHLAVKYDNVGLGEALLRHNANINAFYRGKTPLMRALKYTSAAVRELLLSHRDLDINIQNQARDSPLSYAIHYGGFSIVKSVLEHRAASVDIKHKYGRTALHLAVFAGRIGFVQLLLLSSSDPNLEDDSGQSAWSWACRFNRPVIEMIFSNDPMTKVFLSTKSSQEAELPIHQAVAYRSVEAVKRLLRQKGLNSNIQNRNGYTPPHLAVQTKRLEIVNLILGHPLANVNCKDKDSNTPLWLSTYSSYDEITERLLAEKDIDINFVRGRGRLESPSTSLHHTAIRLDTILLQRLLTVPGIALNLCIAGHSPISVAVYHGHVKTVACLLSIEGVEINRRGLIDPPIYRAVSHSHLDVVRLLVQQGARLNVNKSTVATYDTALCITARGGDLEIVREILRHSRIDINLRNQWFEDPLMLAVRGGHFSIIDALVANPRLIHFSLRRSLDLVKDYRIQRAIQSRIYNNNTTKKLLKRSPRRIFNRL
ncbi:F-box domain, cyclin-like [Penicillium roqueforti FM164]|uniref:F-box domain, cyclin-like n=1 Tax=Penicillium roqueforti (strain FM164) TaxID=1365484 RepID=W6Q889_PENRF|nr:F-box domain, cyclin-like [Penicillium roqueforti FM164]CDM38502.1 F-box domain, cyclin-like [Penicillium roqueforti FM164]